MKTNLLTVLSNQRLKQLVLLAHQMAYLLDKREIFDTVFLDFVKAFDKVHHPTLLRILSCHID